MTRQNLQSIMNLAWKFVKNNNMTMSEALVASWKNAKLYLSLKHSIVNFTFKKVDGTIRNSKGTLCFDVISNNQFSSQQHNGSRKNTECQVYFDIEKQEWRSYRRENLIAIG